jgi:HrpA-like RNA helicase
VAAEPEIRRTSLAASLLELKCLAAPASMSKSKSKSNANGAGHAVDHGISGGRDFDTLEFMDPPDWQAVSSALKSLVFIGALNAHAQPTPRGRAMARLPLAPEHAAAVLSAQTFAQTLGTRVLDAVLGIVSVLSCSGKLFVEPSAFAGISGVNADSGGGANGTDAMDAMDGSTRPDARKMFRHPSGDHLTRLAALEAYAEICSEDDDGAIALKGHGDAAYAGKAGRKRWCREHGVNERTAGEAIRIRAQLRSVCRQMGMEFRSGSTSDRNTGMTLGTAASDAAFEEGVLRSLTAGYASHAAFLQPDGTYRQLIGMSVIKVHPSSVLADKKVPAIVYDELVSWFVLLCYGTN